MRASYMNTIGPIPDPTVPGGASRPGGIPGIAPVGLRPQITKPTLFTPTKRPPLSKFDPTKLPKAWTKGPTMSPSKNIVPISTVPGVPVTNLTNETTEGNNTKVLLIGAAAVAVAVYLMTKK